MGLPRFLHASVSGHPFPGPTTPWYAYRIVSSRLVSCRIVSCASCRPVLSRWNAVYKLSNTSVNGDHQSTLAGFSLQLRPYGIELYSQQAFRTACSCGLIIFLNLMVRLSSMHAPRLIFAYLYGFHRTWTGRSLLSRNPILLTAGTCLRWRVCSGRLPRAR